MNLAYRAFAAFLTVISSPAFSQDFDGRFGAAGWLEPIVPITESISTMQSLSDAGIYGILGASKCDANAVPGAMSCIGGGFFNINNNTVDVQSGYAVYAEGRRYSGAGSTVGMESAMINRGSNKYVSPYTPVTLGLNGSFWASCGRPDVADSQPCTYAYGIHNAGPSHGSPFNTGILFANYSISGFDKTAIDMPERYNVIWRNSANGNVSAAVRSNISNAAQTLALSFENAGIELQQPIGTMISRFASNGVTITPQIFANEINSTHIAATGRVAATQGFSSATVSSPSTMASAGIGATVTCSPGHQCDQLSGQLQLTTGTSGTAPGTLVRVTFGVARSNFPNCVVNGRSNDFGAAMPLINNTATSTLDIINTVAPLASTVYQISYVCGGS